MDCGSHFITGTDILRIGDLWELIITLICCPTEVCGQYF